MQILAAAGSGHGLQPDSGTIQVADNLKIVSFDQRREQLDQNQTLRLALAPDGDAVLYQDRSIHVVSWARRFLFRSDQLETPVSRLSGGEQARILIAALMCRPADILLLDEPTNDLDIPSLNVLEESLNEFPGALVLVTHDRFMLDRVCHQVLGFTGRSKVAFFADYEQWWRSLQHTDREKLNISRARPKKKKKKKTGKLSYLDQREYDQMEEKISTAEQRQQELEALMHTPETAADPEQLHIYWQELEDVQQEITRLYSRWEELENIKDGKE
jgi:ATP-binding cassette subfamily F protein uup